MGWVFGAALVVQVVGVCVTLYGLDDVRRGLFDGRRLPVIGAARDGLDATGRALARSWRWVLHVTHLRRRRTVVGVGAAIASAGALNATVTVSSAPLRLPRRDVDRWPWVLTQLDTLRRRVDANNDNAHQLHTDLRRELADTTRLLRDEMATGDAATADELARTLYGEAGRGVTLAALGIVIALVGSVGAALAALGV